MSQTRLQEEVAVRLEAMSLSVMSKQSAELAKLLESAQVITDPNMGLAVNFSA